MNNTIDTSKEKPLTLGELAMAVLKKWQVDRTPRTFKKWIEDGRERKADHKTIHLDRIYIGGVLHSSMEAYERFIDDLNGRGI